MVNSNFTSSISNSSNSSDGGIVIQPSSQDNNIVSCNGHTFDKRLAYNNGWDIYLACQYGIADKLWSKVKLTETSYTFNNTANYKHLYTINDMDSINDNTAFVDGAIYDTVESVSYDLEYWANYYIIIDIGPKYVSFAHIAKLLKDNKDEPNVLPEEPYTFYPYDHASLSSLMLSLNTFFPTSPNSSYEGASPEYYKMIGMYNRSFNRPFFTIETFLSHTGLKGFSMFVYHDKVGTEYTDGKHITASDIATFRG